MRRLKTGVRQNHNVNLSGGGANNTYNIALDYYGQKGTMVGCRSKLRPLHCPCKQFDGC